MDTPGIRCGAHPTTPETTNVGTSDDLNACARACSSWFGVDEADGQCVCYADEGQCGIPDSTGSISIYTKAEGTCPTVVD